jgi:hypothetical protein
LGLAAEDVSDVENKKHLQKIWEVTGRVSLVLNSICGDRNGM